MTKEDIYKMAQKARFYVERNEVYSPSNQADHELTEYLERFAILVAKHEREKCAKLCDDLDQKLWEDMGEPMSGYGEAIREIT
jgi:hypothetical protein